MFGWLFPRCPLATADKAWVERRMLWLAGRFGIDRLRNARVILPTDDFFPADYTPDADGASRCLACLCEYLGVNPFAVRLEVIPDDQMHGVAGLYQQRARSTIRVAESQLEHPDQLISTLAHELAHELLLKGGHLTGHEWDHELVTDLLPVFLGAGILIANATVQTESGLTHWSIGKQGYLSSITLGYALALFAYARGEAKPAWRKHLRWDARATLQSGLRFLRKTGDSMFRPDVVEDSPETPTTATVLRDLKHPSAALRLSALWDITDHELTDLELLSGLAARLKDRDPEVQRVGILTLGRFGSAAAAQVPLLMTYLHQGRSPLRAASATALAGIGVSDPEVLAAFGRLLTDSEEAVALASAAAIAQLGPAATATIPHLIEVIEWAGGTGDHVRLETCAAALHAVTPEALPLIRRHLDGREPDVRRTVLQAFAGHEMKPPKPTKDKSHRPHHEAPTEEKP